MALVKCKECGKEISSKAVTCPHCGYAARKETKPKGCLSLLGYGILGTFILTIVIGVMNSGSSTSSPTPAKSDETDVAIHACGLSIKVVTQRLKSPSTAKFPDCGWSLNEYEVRRTPDKSVVYVLGHVDSQNGFGAMIRSQFAVKFKVIGDNWTTESVEISQR